MGVVILTADPTPFREGDYVEGVGILCPPTANTTFIFHMKSALKPERDIERWLDVVGYRMVLVTNKVPKMKADLKERIIIHRSLAKTEQNFNRECSAMMKWRDRNRAKGMVKQIPVPIAVSLIVANRREDMRLQRLLASANHTLPADYITALATYGVKPNDDRYSWPKKRKSTPPPSQFRQSDVHWERIVENSPQVRNEIRTFNPEEAPKAMRKRKERVHAWL
jgi:hypothetical protein